MRLDQIHTVAQQKKTIWITKQNAMLKQRKKIMPGQC